jgi:4-hydroxybenzoate polyprenyltransferase/phosphoserine phosphatase
VTKHASVWDMDGTVLTTDVFAESLVMIAFRRPWKLPSVVLWLLRGRGYCKRRVAELVEHDWTTWPLRSEVSSEIAAAKCRGGQCVLATAAHSTVAHRVAAQTGLFDMVLASSDSINLKGAHKRDAIRRWMEQSGHTSYSYGGDSRADLAIWQDADEAFVVQPTARLESRVRALGKPVTVVGKRRPFLIDVVHAMRPHQWLKNLLLFIPMTLAHRIEPVTICNVLVGFVAFSLCASAVYVLNDLGDLASDRLHPRKRYRPFSSGRLTIKAGAMLFIALLAAAFALSATALPPVFPALLSVYLIANVVYSTWLKRKPILDVLILAGMYALRIEAGGVAADVPLSPWILAFSMFFFTSLAFAKRYTELGRLRLAGIAQPAGRGYEVDDTALLESLGTASGYVSILVLALYMNSPAMHALYGESRLLWVVCPLVMYWISRVWLLAKRGALHDDPVVFAVTDRVSLAIAAVCAGLVVGAWSLR